MRAFAARDFQKFELFVVVAKPPNLALVFRSMTASPNPFPSSRKLKILLVEDNLVNRVLAQKLLQKNDHTVTLANNGQEALSHWEAAQPSPFDVILMDIQMPVMDGLQAASHIRAKEKSLQAGSFAQDKPRIHIPIVAMTAHAMKGDRERYLAGGMDGYISKPINAVELERVIQSAVAAFPATHTSQIAFAAENAPVPKHWGTEEARILARFDGDIELARELAELFILESPKYLAQMREAVRDGNSKALVHAAHALKGSVGNFSTTGAHETALQVEMLANSGELAEVLEILNVLEAQLVQLNQTLLGMAKQTVRR
jgi:two-component system sensor histidine kinase/response regulator